VHVGRHDVIEIAQPLEVDVHDDDVRPEPRRDFGRVGPNDPTPEHDHVRRRHAGHATQQDAAPHHRLLEVLRALLDAHLAGDLAHRREQRERALLILDRLVRDGGDLRLHARLRELLVGGEVEVGEDDLPRPEHPDLGGLRLLHLHDHVGVAEDFLRTPADLRADLRVVLVRESAAHTGVGLDHHLMPRADQLIGPGWDHGDTVLVRLDFLGNAHSHDVDLLSPFPVHLRQHARFPAVVR
jgi:hypothetical protein